MKNKRKGEVMHYSCTSLSLSVPHAPDDGQEVQEDVDDVRVKAKSSEDVLLWADGHLLVPQEELSVHSQEL